MNVLFPSRKHDIICVQNLCGLKCNPLGPNIKIHILITCLMTLGGSFFLLIFVDCLKSIQALCNSDLTQASLKLMDFIVPVLSCLAVRGNCWIVKNMPEDVLTYSHDNFGICSTYCCQRQ